MVDDIRNINTNPKKAWENIKILSEGFFGTMYKKLLWNLEIIKVL